MKYRWRGVQKNKSKICLILQCSFDNKTSSILGIPCGCCSETGTDHVIKFLAILPSFSTIFLTLSLLPLQLECIPFGDCYNNKACSKMTSSSPSGQFQKGKLGYYNVNYIFQIMYKENSYCSCCMIQTTQ